MKEKQNYFIVCAPSGVGLTGTLEKLKNSLKIKDPNAHQDIEKILCASYETQNALLESGVDRPDGAKEWPTMYDVSWNLSRSQVTELWEKAVKAALNRLRNSHSTIKLLSCHLLYYGGKRNEFYSPVNTTLLLEKDLQPSHILLLIDDVYDMYTRLSEEKAVFCSKDRMPGHLGRIKEDEGISLKELQGLPSTQLASLCLEWKIGIMTHLLSWRHLEIVIAENFAIQLKTNFLVWGIKQLTDVVALWLKKDEPISVYLSHPISRPRRKYRETGRWHEVVSQFNKLQGLFSKKHLVCIMPSAIDEYRIKRNKRTNMLALRKPILEERWPLPGDIKSVMYSKPNADIDMHHNEILAFNIWNFEDKIFSKLNDPNDSLPETADKVLRTFERQIEFQISSRDHLFVSWCNGILIFRPLFLEGTYSSGVQAEIVHWKLLAKTDHKKLAAFIHFEEDVIVLRDYHNSDNRRKGKMQQQIRDELIEIISQNSSISVKNAELVIDYIDKGRPSEMLEQAPIQPNLIEEIANKIPGFEKKAGENWLLKELTGYSIGIEGISENQIVHWIFKDMDELESKYSEIANFLKEL